MPANTYTFLTSATFELTTSKAVTIECYGAGGRGSKTGNGGSGGAYSKVIKTLGSGSYLLGVGQNDYNGYGNGGDTWFKSGSADVIICQAGGGRQDGTTTWQLSQATGSTKYYGGLGCPDFTGYSSYNGSGGGSGASSTANGLNGQSALDSTTETGAAGGRAGSAGAGGNGGFYYAGANVNQVFGPTPGVFPGGGGGGSYDYGTRTESAGAGGVIYLTY